MTEKIIPCNGCNEICVKIEELIATYLELMNFSMTRQSVRAFWKTLLAFSAECQSKDLLSFFYVHYMSNENKKNISKNDFVAYMESDII